ncbi:MAG TPA: ABA4-like family protein [Pyrinomonadaceae bacterium]|nr:ABA4-like family protein [Pyrinomonadaceae bacterium]
MEEVFKLSSLLVAPFWLMMMLLPRWRFTVSVMRSPLVALGPAVLYAALMIPRLLALAPALLRPELPTIAALLGTPEGATLAWAHFLAFDLFVGRWVYLDGRERGVSAWVASPVLFLTLLAGPLGFLLHLAARRLPGRASSERVARDAAVTPKI